MTFSIAQVEGGAPIHTCTPPMSLGEAPIYRARDSTLHWVNCLSLPAELHILRVDPDSGAPVGDPRVLTLADSVTVVCFRRDYPGSYICAYHQGIALLDEETGRLDVLKEIVGREERGCRRMNDGGVDAMGRFWVAENDISAMKYGVGNLPEDYGTPKGRLWRYDPDGSLHQMDEGFVCGNGVCWSPDGKTMYINDSVGQKNYAYTFDLATGTLSNRRLLLDRRLQNLPGEPDGQVVDSDGNIWNAVYDSRSVMVYSPSGILLMQIMFNARRLTCPTWGGRDMNLLFVTSGREEGGAEGDAGGYMFCYKAEGIRGWRKNEFSG